jgi:hypothetical protein
VDQRNGVTNIVVVASEKKSLVFFLKEKKEELTSIERYASMFALAETRQIYMQLTETGK